MTVKYRRIPGFQGYYAGSDGTIWCDHPLPWWPAEQPPGPKRPVTPTRRKADGKLMVGVLVDKRHQQVAVDRLVLLAFRGEPPSQWHRAVHRDRDESNNRPRNLRYVNDGPVQGQRLFGALVNSSKLNDKAVLTIRNRAANGEPMTHLAKEFGVSPTTVRLIVLGQTWRHLLEKH